MAAFAELGGPWRRGTSEILNTRCSCASSCSPGLHPALRRAHSPLPAPSPCEPSGEPLLSLGPKGRERTRMLCRGGPVIWVAQMPGGGGEARRTGLRKGQGPNLPRPPSSSSPLCPLLTPAHIALEVPARAFGSMGKLRQDSADRMQGWELIESRPPPEKGGNQGASGEGAGRKPETIG